LVKLAQELLQERRTGSDPGDRDTVGHLPLYPFALFQLVSREGPTRAFNPHDLGLDADDAVSLPLDGGFDAAR